MLIGNDMDSVLCACFLHARFGWDVAGMYDYRTLWFTGERGRFLADLGAGRHVAIDLSPPSIYSLGHHILEHASTDRLPGHARTLNPNFIRGINAESFRRKYPLSAIHFLLWLFDATDLPRSALLAAWLADSAIVNGQSHKFADNVRKWIQNYLDLEAFIKLLDELDTREFELELASGILNRLGRLDLCKPGGQVKSRHLKLNGFQCQWKNPNEQRESIQRVFETMATLTGWSAPRLPDGFQQVEGARSAVRVSEMVQQFGSLDSFVERERVFSYVFPYSDSINYTTGIFKEEQA